MIVYVLATSEVTIGADPISETIILKVFNSKPTIKDAKEIEKTLLENEVYLADDTIERVVSELIKQGVSVPKGMFTSNIVLKEMVIKNTADNKKENVNG